MAHTVALENWTAPPAPWAARRRDRILAPPERVFRALVEPADLTAWWCSEASVDARAGGRYECRGIGAFADLIRAGGDGAAEIAELEPGRRLTLRWRLNGVDTIARFELDSHLEQTDITVAHTAPRSPGWEPGPDAPDGWWVALAALRERVESGRAALRVDLSEHAGVPSESALRLALDVTTFPWIVWSKLTLAAELDRWWARGARVELAPGGAFALGLAGGGPERIEAIEPGARLVHDWRWPDGTLGRVAWTLEETEDATRILVDDLGPRPGDLPSERVVLLRAATLLELARISRRGVATREFQ